MFSPSVQVFRLYIQVNSLLVLDTLKVLKTVLLMYYLESSPFPHPRITKQFSRYKRRMKSLKKFQLLISSVLRLKKVNFLGVGVSLFFDVSNDTVRPFVPESLRRAVFNSLHGLSHPEVRIRQRLVTSRFVWPAINKDCRDGHGTAFLVSGQKLQGTLQALLVISKILADSNTTISILQDLC